MTEIGGGSLMVNISDMIDLAIGTPEVGVVDFNMLQMVLHCFAQQLRVQGKNVELRGSASSMPVLRDNAQTIAVSEFIIDTDQHKSRTPKNYEQVKAAAAASTPDDSILVVERVKRQDAPYSTEKSFAPGTGGGRAGGGAGAAGGAGTGGGTGTAGGTGAGSAGRRASAGGQQVAGGPERLTLVTLSKFNLLDDTVRDLKKRVYGSMPKNEEILEEVRSQTNLKSITDMWTNLNVSSRLEAAENGIAKLSSLVEDLIGETVDLQKRASKTGEPSSGRTTRPSTPVPPSGTKSTAGMVQKSGIKSMAGMAQKSATTPSVGVAPPENTTAPFVIEGGQDALTLDDLKGFQEYVNDIRADLDNLKHNFNAAVDEMMDNVYREPAGGGGADSDGGVRSPRSTTSAPERDETEGRKEGKMERGAVPLPQEKPRRASISSVVDRIAEVEKRLNHCCNDTNRHISKLTDHVNSIDDQLQYLMKQGVGIPSDKAGSMLSPDLAKDLRGLMDLFATVQEMQEQLEQVHETALKLAGEKEDRQHHINALLEQIELLKAVKMDREDMAEAMAEKADLRALARKVSHDQFEMACEDLAKGLENAIGKLNMQEALWQQALDDIQREIETKLDKMELSPVKDFFNSKLKQLQENLKQMASLRREVEAAGTKRRLLRDVNCIACDANAVMQTETAAAIPTSKPLPATLSMKPYLSYELDAIRKAQASNVPQRNMHDWENINKQMQPKPLQKVRSETDKHLCNRYCGGSHTVTTPAQRVARLGHFVKQWGPDVLPLTSGLAAGDDGKMYKVTTGENANVGPGDVVETTCTPKTPPKKDLKPLQRPIVMSAECRCLEGDAKA